jgi:hypothetical protein
MYVFCTNGSWSSHHLSTFSIGGWCGVIFESCTLSSPFLLPFPFLPSVRRDATPRRSKTLHPTTTCTEPPLATTTTTFPPCLPMTESRCRAVCPTAIQFRPANLHPMIFHLPSSPILLPLIIPTLPPTLSETPCTCLPCPYLCPFCFSGMVRFDTDH